MLLTVSFLREMAESEPRAHAMLHTEHFITLLPSLLPYLHSYADVAAVARTCRGAAHAVRESGLVRICMDESRAHWPCTRALCFGCLR